MNLRMITVDVVDGGWLFNGHALYSYDKNRKTQAMERRRMAQALLQRVSDTLGFGFGIELIDARTHESNRRRARPHDSRRSSDMIERRSHG